MTADGHDGLDGSMRVSPRQDPHEVLAGWANEQDEWLRLIVRDVLSTGRPVTDSDVNRAYELFRQEKGLELRTLPVEEQLAVEDSDEEAELPLVLKRLSDVNGVNAIAPGSVIEPHAGMTILFGENGTGKTGYARIFKALAGSRTADSILGDISASEEQPQSARIQFSLGGEDKEFVWTGEQGQPPFTRMSIFDSPSVNFHVDEDLEYVYVPTALSLFNHVVGAIRLVQNLIEGAIADAGTGATTLLGRFPREASVYPLIETLGASTDLADLEKRADRGEDAGERTEILRQAVAALDSNTLVDQISRRQRYERVLLQAGAAVEVVAALDTETLNALVTRLSALRDDYRRFRGELFAAADLPAEPDETWESFIRSGGAYRHHLEDLGVHDPTRCLYCRQTLDDSARQLVQKYGEYLADKINEEISTTEREISEVTNPARAIQFSEASAFLDELEDRGDKPTFYEDVLAARAVVVACSEGLESGTAIGADVSDRASSLGKVIAEALAAIRAEILELSAQAADRASALAGKKRELVELVAATELARSWPIIQGQVASAKEADRLRLLLRALPGKSRAVTELAKSVSDQLMNQNFENLFVEECAALRAPRLRVEFVGRQGRAQRRKSIGGRHKPSKVLSEGEQKVLAIADFLAEARLSGTTAPVIFDDPVSSLDHRRINEVARRIASLADHNQVVVFTHDIFFATTLLSLFESSRRCSYFQVTDDGGIGRVTRASGPRWDTLNNLKAHVNRTIQAARAQEGEARAALVREGYDWIRSWCEVFTEKELLRGVSERYQPHIRMTLLPSIKTAMLPETIAVVTRVFDNACRYIPSHSQPLPTLGVAPTLSGLEGHWQELSEAKKTYDDA